MVVAHCEGTISEVNKYIDIATEWVYDGRVSRTVSEEGKDNDPDQGTSQGNPR